ncbi:MAG: ATP-binding protein [Spirochaetales bacterium]|nr:ATP-binding protein [Candidatus Physcosoma equi]
MELKRKIHESIREWYFGSNKALLISGARQVGKTYTVRSSLKELGCSFVEVNLIETPLAVDVLSGCTTVDELILGLSTLVNKPIVKGKTVIFIDEAQKYKELVTRIKFFVEEGSFRYVLSGSLLGIELTNLISAPVGYLTTYEMFPLDFEEFLQITNINAEVLLHVKQALAKRTPVLDAVHEKLMALFKQYLVVGGMPEAVVKFAETYDLNAVSKIHSNILKLYRLDFTQYESGEKKLILGNIFDMVPAELLKQNRRFIVSDLKKGLHFERIENSFLWLRNAGVVISVFNATEPRFPLKLSEKQSLFKLYLSDVGLLTTIFGMGAKSRILAGDSTFNGGGIYENAVVQALHSKGYRIYYYNSKRLGELDFVIEHHGSIVPIEVKSGKDYTAHSALNHCLESREYGMEEAFVFASCNVEKRGKATYLPIYMTGFLEAESELYVPIERISF